MVDYGVRGSVAVLEVNNPPVNALSHHVRVGLADNLPRACADPSVKAIVLCGKGGKFIAGADIREFGGARQGPMINEVCDVLEKSQKPVIAAINGFALGGGLEVAISCHYRVSTPSAQFGFPEVNIGILPGATGTQRFPRLTSLKYALDLIPTGRRIGAAEALKHGVIDKVVTNDLLQEALDMAKSVSQRGTAGRRTSEMQVKDKDQADALIQGALQRAASRAKGLLAPMFCIKAVAASVQFPFEKGLEKEQEYSMVLVTSGQARALQYAFFAERAAQKWTAPGGASFKNTKPLPYKTGAVIGAGTMGTGITMAMLNAGIPVTLLEQNQQFLDKGVAAIKDLYKGSVRLGRMTEEQARKRLSQLTPTLEYAALKDRDIVIEAVYENMGLKKDVFRKLDQACKPSALLCSNTSALNIDEIASATTRPDKVIGCHFFVPAYYMRLLENIRGEKTSPQTMATAMDFGVRIGKVPVLVGNCDGFVANRLMGCYSQENQFLLEDGCLPHQVDQVIEDFGIPIGPCKVADLSGLDISWRRMKEFLEKNGIAFDPKRTVFFGRRYSTLRDQMCEAGRFGRKSGAGWYKYDRPGAKVPRIDPFTQQLIERHSQAIGIKRRHISPQEIFERCIYSSINEGFKILEEGIASKPEDIDITIILGYGWPRQTGGPMYMASQIGLHKLYDRIMHYHQQHPLTPHWEPSKLLKQLKDGDVPFNRWAQAAAAATSKL